MGEVAACYLEPSPLNYTFHLYPKSDKDRPRGKMWYQFWIRIDASLYFHHSLQCLGYPKDIFLVKS